MSIYRGLSPWLTRPHVLRIRGTIRGRTNISFAQYLSISADRHPGKPEEPEILVQTLKSENFPGASVALWTLNRPPANAMGRNMLQELQEALGHLEQDIAENRPETPRCLVLASSLSPKVFSAGADLKERKTMSLEEAATFVDSLRMSMNRLSRLAIPVIAAVHGVAVGGGLEIALAADIRIASRSSRWGLPETSLAIVPGAGGTQRLPRLIGVGKAKELIFTAARFDGLAAAEYGLVQRVVEDDEDPLDAALDMAWAIARNGPVAIQAAKWAIDEGTEAVTMEDALEVEKEAYNERVLPTTDRLEGLAAFKEGRPPEYRGR